MENALDFLLDQAQEKEHNAVMALNKARSELENYHKQIEQIEQYRLDYCNQMVQRGMSGLTASQYGHLNRFLTQLDETLTKQRSAQSQFEQQVANCEKHWLEVRKQRRSYEWLLEKNAVKSKKQRNGENKKSWMSSLRYSLPAAGNHTNPLLACFLLNNIQISRKFSELTAMAAISGALLPLVIIVPD